MDALEFSEPLRRVLNYAREEAVRLQHEHIGTEHMLLALLRDAEQDGTGSPSTAVVVLDVLGVDRVKMRQVLEQTVLRGRATGSTEQQSYTSRARAVLELARTEARVLKHDAVSTEHLLLGLLREERGIAAQILLDFGVTVEKAQQEVARLA